MSNQVGEFRDFFGKIEPIRMRDPLATILGAFDSESDIIEYHWEAASEGQKTEFRNLWTKRVRLIALEEQNREQWLKIS